MPAFKSTELLDAAIDAYGVGVSLRGISVATDMTEVKPTMHISEGHGLYGEGRIVGMIQIFKNKTRSFRLNHFLRRNDLLFVHSYPPNFIFFTR